MSTPGIRNLAVLHLEDGRDLRDPLPDHGSEDVDELGHRQSGTNRGITEDFPVFDVDALYALGPDNFHFRGQLRHGFTSVNITDRGSI